MIARRLNRVCRFAMPLRADDPQADTERLLDDYLGELGVTAERGVEVSGFSQGEDGMDATLLQSDGRQETVSVAWLRGCSTSVCKYDPQLDQLCECRR